MAQGPNNPRLNRPGSGKNIVSYQDPDLYRQLIQGLGLMFRWSRAVQCPCRINEDTDQPDPTCTRCGGDGWWYVNPDQKVDRHTNELRDYMEVKAAFSSSGLNPDLYQNFGRFEHGDATLAVQSETRVGFRDRFIAMEQEMAWSEVVHRTTSRADVPVGRTGRTTVEQRWSMRYEPIRVDFVADETQRYYEGEDWILSQETLRTPAYPGEPRKLTWQPLKGPADGDRYTVHYVCRPVWVVDEVTYAVQHLYGPEKGILGKPVRQLLPTTFKVKLDFLTGARGA